MPEAKLEKSKYRIAIYIRLSKEDENQGFNESESITNQKALLMDYVGKLGADYELIDTYVDPGYTGTNFNRPDFRRMIKDIEIRQSKYGYHKRFISSRA